jgi:hypothetical protein
MASALFESARSITDLAALTDPWVMPTDMTNSGSTVVQKWKVEAVSDKNWNYELSTVYYGNSFSIPTFEKPGMRTVAEDFLCSYRTNANGLVTPYSNDQDIVIIGASLPSSSNNILYPFEAQSRDGSFIFTVQPVNYVLINLSTDGVPTGKTSEDYYFSVGENNPYVIVDHSSAVTISHPNLYKLAVNPKDLYTSGSTPMAPFDHQPTDSDTAGTFNMHIYSPEDILYPLDQQGGVRTTANGSVDPAAVYASISDTARKSYSFIGVEGYKLAGYKVTNPKYSYGFYNFIINTPPENSGCSFKIIPCRKNMADEIVTNMLDLGSVSVWCYSGPVFEVIEEPVVMTPIFVPDKPINVSLVYNEEQTSNYAYGSKEAVMGNYDLVISGADM